MRRWTNLALLLLIAAAFLTGWLAFSYATAPARWSLVVHAASGVAILALTPWKSLIVRGGLRHRRHGWWASLIFTVLVLLSIVAGFLHSTGLLRWWGDITAMEVHVGAAIAAVPFGIWHLVARWVPPRAVDLSRRSLLRGGLLLGAAGLVYAATEGLVRLAALPGASRRFTGSYEVASYQPDAMPVTQWMFDSVPTIPASTWRLRVHAAGQVREWTYDQLAAFDDRATATLDCTGGFYSKQEWAGAWLSRLVPVTDQPLSVRVRSVTGYDRRFAAGELSRVLLATRLGGQPLSPGHGFPVRVVAPDRRGFWWIKWVTRVEVETTPAWWQLPFPLQ
ncbi:MAG TPA: molybdopterin-dependent oxidoreductase [Candidatus Eisenbacteria bacterium]|nr:molybdopterin-dependent oxidoreductase [Candidatus Eisenbacteria bacterium]